MKTNSVRRALTVGAALIVVASAAVAANAVVQDPPNRQGSLASFGPLMDNGFPTSYKDTHGVRLEACITADDPLCAAAAGPTSTTPTCRCRSRRTSPTSSSTSSPAPR